MSATPSSLPRQAGHSLLLDSPALVDWLNRACPEGGVLLTQYQRLLRHRSLAASPVAPRELRELDTLNWDLAASLALLTGLLYMRVDYQTSQVKEALADFPSVISEQEKTPAYLELSLRYRLLDQHWRELDEQTQTLGNYHTALREKISDHLTLLQLTRQQHAPVPPAAREVEADLLQMAADANAIRFVAHELMRRAEAPLPGGTPPSAEETALLAFCRNSVLPHILAMDDELRRRATGLAPHWAHVHDTHWADAPPALPATEVSNVVQLDAHRKSPQRRA